VIRRSGCWAKRFEKIRQETTSAINDFIKFKIVSFPDEYHKKSGLATTFMVEDGGVLYVNWISICGLRYK
jgi:hypothetical protein